MKDDYCHYGMKPYTEAKARDALSEFHKRKDTTHWIFGCGDHWHLEMKPPKVKEPAKT